MEEPRARPPETWAMPTSPPPMPDIPPGWFDQPPAPPRTPMPSPTASQRATMRGTTKTIASGGGLALVAGAVWAVGFAAFAYVQVMVAMAAHRGSEGLMEATFAALAASVVTSGLGLIALVGGLLARLIVDPNVRTPIP